MSGPNFPEKFGASEPVPVTVPGCHCQDSQRPGCLPEARQCPSGLGCGRRSDQPVAPGVR
eukprot:122791-Hanusia_phi.AAC.1